MCGSSVISTATRGRKRESTTPTTNGYWTLNKMQYKYEMHCHTKMVSQCGQVEPEEVVRLYKEHGYSGIVVTEHYSPLTYGLDSYHKPERRIHFYLSSYRKMKEYEDENFKVFLGMELRHYATANDYLIYGVTEEWLLGQSNLMLLFERSMYKTMHEAGFLVYQAHPFRPFIRRCNPKYVDGIEIYNGKTDRYRNYKALNWAATHKKLMISGSDFHEKEHLARGGIITTRPIKDNADLVRILKAQDFEMIRTFD